MAKKLNRYSPTCPTITVVHSLLEKILQSGNVGVVANLLGMYEERLEQKASSSDKDKEKYDITEKNLKEISDLCAKHEPLTHELRQFVTDLAMELNNLVAEYREEEERVRYIRESGVLEKNFDEAEVYERFKQIFPNSRERADLVGQCVALILKVLDAERDRHPDYTTEELIISAAVRMGGHEVLGIPEALSFICQHQISNKYATLKMQLRHQNEKNKRNDSLPKNLVRVFDILTDKNRQDAWATLMFMSRHLLFDATGIRIGDNISYAEALGIEEDSDEFDNDGHVHSAEEENPEHWTLRADTISSFASLTMEARSILYRVVEYSSGGKVKRGILGYPTLIDVMKLHQLILEVREEGYCQTSEEFMDLLEERIKKVAEKNASLAAKDRSYMPNDNCWEKVVYNALRKNAKLRTSFFNCYRKNHLNYHAYNSRKGAEGRIFYRKASGVDGDVVLSSYFGEYLEIDPENKNCIFDSHGVCDVTKLAGLIKPLLDEDNYTKENGYRKDIDIYLRLNPSNNEDERKTNFVLYINDALNLKLSESDIDKIVQNNNAWIDFSKGLYSLAKELNNVYKKDTTKNLQSVIADSRNLGYAFKNFLKKSTTKISTQERKSPVERAFRYNKSTYVCYTIPNTVGDNIEKIAKAASKGNDALIEFLEKEFFICPIFAEKVVKDGKEVWDIHNLWLEKLYQEASEGKDLTNKDSFTYAFTHSVTRGLGFNDKAFKEFSEKDNFLFALNEYYQKIVETKKENTGASFCAVPLFVTGDSNSTRFFDVPVYSEQDAIDKLIDIAYQEFDRIDRIENFKDWCAKHNFNLRGGPSLEARFSYFDSFNEPDTKEYLLKEWEKVRNEDEDKKEEFKNLLREYVLQELNSKYAAFCDKLLDKGIIKPIPGAQGLYTLNNEEIYIPQLTRSNGENLFKPIPDSYKDARNLKLEQGRALWQFYLNEKMHMATQLQLFTIDPCFYEGTEDLQKRYKEMIAAGTPLDLAAIDPSDPEQTKHIDSNGTQRVVYLSDERRDMQKEDPEFYGLAERTLDDKKKLDLYHRASLTDGQAFRSFSSYRKIIIMSGGRWTNEMEEVYQIISRSRQKWLETHSSLEGHRLSQEDFRRVVELNVVFQPLKPFYYGFEELTLSSDDKDKLFVPVQLKYSEYPVIPELLPKVPVNKLDEKGNPILDEKGNPIKEYADSKLASLGYLLEDEKIDLAAFTTCVKVGGFGDVSITNCRNYSDLRNAINASSTKKHDLKLSGYRIQSNIPESYDHPRARGTQATKHALGGLKEAVKKIYPFLKRLFSTTNRIIIANKTRSHEEVAIDVKNGITSEGLIQLIGALGSIGFLKSTTQLVNTFKDKKAQSKTLTKIKSNDKRAPKSFMSSYKLTGEEGEENFNIAPSEGISAVDNIAAMQSKLRKDVIKQRMAGGSAVQVSAYGFEDVLKVHFDYETDEKGVKHATNMTYVDCAVPFDFSYTVVDSKGNETVVHLDYFEYVDPYTGMLLDEDGNAVEPGEGKSKLEKEFPGMLDMVAYRIPTEKFYSMIALKAKRFFPKTCGATIMVPTQFTVIAGFDFDIDKLYFFKKEFKFRIKDENSSILNIEGRNYKVWTSWHNSHKGRKMYPYIVAAIALERLGSEAIKDYMVEVDGEQHKIPIDVHSKETMDAITEKVEKLHDKARGIQKFDYIDFYNSALRLMQQDGVDISEYSDIKEDEYLEVISSSDYRKNYTEAIYEFDESKDIVSNSQEATNNLFFELLYARLTDQDTLKERLTPGGCYNFERNMPLMWLILSEDPEIQEKLKNVNSYEDLTELLKEIPEDKLKPKYNPTDLSTVAHYQSYNAEYDDMIGITANISINLRIISLSDLFELKERGSNNKKSIRIGSMIDAPIEEGTGSSFHIRMLNGQDTEINTTECLNGSVDAVKKAILEFFGISRKSVQMACILTELGATPVDVGLLLNQPVIRMAADKVKEANGYKSFDEALLESLTEIAGDQKMNQLNDLRDSFNEDLSLREKYLTLDALSKCFNPNYRRTDEFLKIQAAAVHFVSDLSNIANEMSDQINITKETSTNSVKSDIGNAQVMEQRAIRFNASFGGKDSNFRVVVRGKEVNKDTKWIDPYARVGSSYEDARDFLAEYSDSPCAMEQAAFSAIMTFLDNAIGKLFPYRTRVFKQVSNVLASFTKRGFLDAETFNSFNRDFMLFCLEQTISEFNSNNSEGVVVLGQQVPIPPRIFYLKYFPSLLYHILEQNDFQFREGSMDRLYRDIPILGALSIDSSLQQEEYYDPKKSEGKKVVSKRVNSLIMKSIGNQVTYQKDELIESWEAMLGDSDPLLADLAKHLFFYSYYKRGFDFAQDSIMYLAPTELKKQISQGKYKEFFDNIFDLSFEEYEEGDMSYENQGRIVYKPKKDNTEGQVVLFVKNLVKAYILNHLKEKYPFARDIYPKDITCRDLAGNQALIKGVEISEDFNTITLNIDKLTNKTQGASNGRLLMNKLATRITNSEGQTIGYKFIPCIIYNNDAYICDVDIANPELINFSTVEAIGEQRVLGSITYYRMKPILGGKDYSTPQLFSEAVELSDQTGDLLDAINEGLQQIEDNVADDSNNVRLEGDDNQLGNGSLSMLSKQLLLNSIIYQTSAIMAFANAFGPDVESKVKAIIQSLNEEDWKKKTLRAIGRFKTSVRISSKKINSDNEKAFESMVETLETEVIQFIDEVALSTEQQEDIRAAYDSIKVTISLLLSRENELIKEKKESLRDSRFNTTVANTLSNLHQTLLEGRYDRARELLGIIEKYGDKDWLDASGYKQIQAANKILEKLYNPKGSSKEEAQKEEGKKATLDAGCNEVCG